MYVFHSTVRVKPGRERDYEDFAHRYRDNADGVPGFVRRLMLKDREHPGNYFFMAF